METPEDPFGDPIGLWEAAGGEAADMPPLPLAAGAPGDVDGPEPASGPAAEAGAVQGSDPDPALGVEPGGVAEAAPGPAPDTPLPAPEALLAPAQVRAWRQYFETSQALQNRLEAQLRKHSELRLADYNLCLMLHSAPDRRLRLGDLARGMVFSPSRLSYMVSTLCGKGIIHRVEDPEDRRATLAELTDHGVEVFTAARRVHRRHVHDLFFRHLSSEEVTALEILFSRIHQALLEED
ncbi:MarR family winged helix-turn-helix transcriptional regulator [Rothia halotolerans]|uniref:MarR family winged helix-turn-helix transcriptional regulator n=1 Tax=Rothia halotolerans TaxID=405770 RepID=UPI00101CFAA9|nr:MarR family winged helix-turn-helix transcriptional regulator [Rothia halotolerans]